MATQQILTNAALGKFLQTVYSEGITNQISEDYRDWEMVKKMKVTDQAARSVDFLINKTYGAPAVKMKNSGSVDLPSGKQTKTAEGSAGFNQMYATIELEYDLWKRAKSGAKKYLEPLAHEIQAKGIVQKRLLSAQFHLDGTGIYGEVDSATAVDYIDDAGTTVTNGALEVVLKSADTSRGGVRYLEYGDEIEFAAAVGTAAAAATSVYTVEEKNRKTNTLTLVRTSGAVDESGSLPVDGENLYREGSTKINTTVAITGEYNDLSEDMCGIETLTAKDKRQIHGLRLSGVYQGEHSDAEGAPVDISHLEAAMNGIKTRNGQTFEYSQVLCAPETQSAFIESQEADRRLQSNSDDQRGFKGFRYIHGQDALELQSSEFCGAKRMWVIPAGEAIELHGKDFEEIQLEGQSQFLKAASAAGGSYQTTVQKFMMGYMTMICKRPGSILKIHNFAV